jgi:ComF family protein
MSAFKNLFTDLSNLLFLDLCNACGTLLYHGEYLICLKCTYSLPFTDFHVYEENPVAKQFWGRIPIHAAMSLLYFNKGLMVQSMIHALKYKGKEQLGFELGKMIGEKLLHATAYQNITLIIPVPLHNRQFKNRGYNQSKLIADGIGEVLHVPVNCRVLVRNVSTESQTKKTRFNRYLNMKTVFSVKYPLDLENQYVLLVDDVMTTGSTLEACGKELLKYNVNKLSIATIAFAK